MSYHGDPVQDVMRLYGPFGIYRVGGCEIKIDPDDAEKIHTRSYTTEELSGWFKVPPEAVSTYGAVSHKDVPLLVRGADSCKYSLREWKDGSGTVLASIDANGNVVIPQGGSYVPPDIAASITRHQDALSREPECTCETLLHGHHDACPYMRAKNDRR